MRRPLLAGAIACGAIIIGNPASAQMMNHAPTKNQYVQANLVSDGSIPAATTDENLANPWGIANLPGAPFWIDDTQTGVATLYDGNGVQEPISPVPLVVTIPPHPAPTSPNTSPTGIVANTTSGFVVTGTNAPALFIFDTEDGTISAWNPNNSPPIMATLMVDNSGTGAVYKGLAMGSNANGAFLYATNFNSGKIDVFNGNFAPAALSGAFSDPGLPAGYAPFGIANINGELFVTYALQDGAKHDDVAGHGHGFVDIFDTQGNLIRRFASRGSLNSPWGVTQATFNFGAFSGAILVGNFGDGTINAFDPVSGKALGQLHGAQNKAIVIDGLWALTFGNGALNALPDRLYFTAGPDHEQQGLFGSLAAQ